MFENSKIDVIVQTQHPISMPWRGGMRGEEGPMNKISQVTWGGIMSQLPLTVLLKGNTSHDKVPVTEAFGLLTCSASWLVTHSRNDRPSE